MSKIMLACLAASSIACASTATEFTTDDTQAVTASDAPFGRVYAASGPVVQVSTRTSSEWHGQGCALKRSGAVRCWIGDPHGEANIDHATNFYDVPGVTDAVQVAAGAENDCARRRDGSIVCWEPPTHVPIEKMAAPLPIPFV